MRIVRTRVLPEPAPAMTSEAPSLLVTASYCCLLRSDKKSIIPMIDDRVSSTAQIYDKETKGSYVIHLLIRRINLLSLVR